MDSCVPESERAQDVPSKWVIEPTPPATQTSFAERPRMTLTRVRGSIAPPAVAGSKGPFGHSVSGSQRSGKYSQSSQGPSEASPSPPSTPLSATCTVSLSGGASFGAEAPSVAHARRRAVGIVAPIATMASHGAGGAFGRIGGIIA